jgi:hypothetical protein
MRRCNTGAGTGCGATGYRLRITGVILTKIFLCDNLSNSQPHQVFTKYFTILLSKSFNNLIFAPAFDSRDKRCVPECASIQNFI